MNLKNKKLRYATLCSGIEAPSLAWESLGWDCVFFSEVDKYANQILKQHFPNIPNLGNINDIKATKYANKVDLLIAGTPCQSFSIAGKGKSLNDPRGNLSLKFGDICNEIDPEFIIWENVPGAISTKDNAFGAILSKFCGDELPLQPPGEKWSNAGCVFGSKRTVAWRIFNAQYFGVPQQRRRLIAVGCPRNGYNPLKILFESEAEVLDCPTNAKIRKASTNNYQGKYPIKRKRDIIQPHIFKIRCGCVGGGKGYMGQNNLSYTLSTRADQFLFNNDCIRRLTPKEHERLQGIPDNYTRLPNSSDSSRFRAIGNSMPVPLIKWIGIRIQALINESC